jgi:hypothetical protein
VRPERDQSALSLAHLQSMWRRDSRVFILNINN